MPTRNGFPVSIEVTISSGSQESTGAALSALGEVTGVEWPSSLSGTTYDLEGSIDGGNTYDPLYDNGGNQLQITAQTDAITFLDLQSFLTLHGLTHVRLNSDVNEGSTRTITIIGWQGPKNKG